MKRIGLIGLVLVFFSTVSFAQDGLEGVWYNTIKSGKIEIKEVNGEYIGNIIWIDDPLDENGKPKTNIFSPNKDEHNDPIIGLKILWGFESDGDNIYSGGRIYDPENGKTYKGKMTLNGDALDLRGYVGIPAFGRTEKWTRTK